jgi:hypothetical protein
MGQELRDRNGNYTINGQTFPSMTKVLKAMCPKMALDNWKERTPNWKAIGSQAAVRGTLMHMKLQCTVSDILPDWPKQFDWDTEIATDPELWDELDGRLEQWLSIGLEIERPNLVEHTVYVDTKTEHGHARGAGTLDLYAKVDDVPVVLDWKSSKRPQKSHRYQVGGYAWGLRNEGYEVRGAMIPYIRRNSWEMVEMYDEELEEAIQGALKVMADYNTKYGNLYTQAKKIA